MLYMQLRLFKTTKKTEFITRQFTCFKKGRNEIPDILAAGEQAKVAAITATGVAVHSLTVLMHNSPLWWLLRLTTLIMYFLSKTIM